MKIKLFTSVLLSVTALFVFGCTEDSDEETNKTCVQDCSAMVGGPFEKYCGRVNGEYRCLDKCDAQAEGETAPVCHEVTADHSVVSSVQKCAKDDDGQYYADGYSNNICSDGCGDEKPGLCNTGDPIVENNCKAKNTTVEYVVTTVNGEKSCGIKCYGENEGKNASFCYEVDSVQYSGTTTCAKDDNGILYAGFIDGEACDGACVTETGLCEKAAD